METGSKENSVDSAMSAMSAVSGASAATVELQELTPDSPRTCGAGVLYTFGPGTHLGVAQN